MKTERQIFRIFEIIGALSLCGCASMTASVDRSDAKAKDEAPESAQVEVLEIAYDEDCPIYVVAVGRIQYGAADVISGQGPQEPGSPNPGMFDILAGRGDSMHTSVDLADRYRDDMILRRDSDKICQGIAAQLETALSRSGNIQLIELSAVSKDEKGAYTYPLEENEIGPFVITGTISEISETADLSEDKKGVSLGAVGIAAAILGSVTGNDALELGGGAVAVVNPNMEKGKVKRKGMLGMDLKIVDGRRPGKILGGFNCSGTFTTISSVSGMSILGIGKSGSEFAASALGQATRAALNKAVESTTGTLKAKARAPKAKEQALVTP